jgi:ATP-dependent exoDNAse (exonuclease V) alpha subunit
MSEEPDDRQAEALRLVAEGRNVFLTGAAGTGKSFVLRKVLEALRARYDGDEAEFRRRVAVTAPTGAAATLLGGQTLNSALGVGAPSLRRDFRAVLSPRNRPRMRQLDVLVVDEVSMLSGEFLEEVEHVMRVARDDGRPAGGVQLVFAGDFHQASWGSEDRRERSLVPRTSLSPPSDDPTLREEEEEEEARGAHPRHAPESPRASMSLSRRGVSWKHVWSPGGYKRMCLLNAPTTCA